MKYNNIETLATALESAVQELAETKRQLWIANDKLGDAKQELAEVNDKLAEAEVKAHAAEFEVAINEMTAENWEKRAVKAERILTQGFDNLLWQYAWECHRELTCGDNAEARGAKMTLKDVIATIYQLSVNVLSYPHHCNQLVIEVWGGKAPLMFYYWDVDEVFGKFAMKFEANEMKETK